MRIRGTYQLDDETFGAVRERALAARTSLAEQVRQLIEIGLEEVDRDSRERAADR